MCHKKRKFEVTTKIKHTPLILTIKVVSQLNQPGCLLQLQALSFYRNRISPSISHNLCALKTVIAKVA